MDKNEEIQGLLNEHEKDLFKNRNQNNRRSISILYVFFTLAFIISLGLNLISVLVLRNYHYQMLPVEILKKTNFYCKVSNFLILYKKKLR